VFARLIEPKAIGLVQVAITLSRFSRFFVEHGFTTTVIRNRTLGAHRSEYGVLDERQRRHPHGDRPVPFCPAGCCRVRLPELVPVLRIVAWCLPITTLGVIQSAVLTRGSRFARRPSGG